MHDSKIRKGVRFEHQVTGGVIEVVMLRKAQPTWFVVYLDNNGDMRRVSHSDFQKNFTLYVPKGLNTSQAS